MLRRLKRLGANCAEMLDVKARTDRYKNSSLPFLTKILNKSSLKKT